MKLTLADITPNRLKFNSHKEHNPNCDILQLKISNDSFITYYRDLKNGNEGMEYYEGANYVPDSVEKSYSRHYPQQKIPKKYKSVWNGLKYYYETNYKNNIPFTT